MSNSLEDIGHVSYIDCCEGDETSPPGGFDYGPRTRDQRGRHGEREREKSHDQLLDEARARAEAAKATAKRMSHEVDRLISENTRLTLKVSDLGRGLDKALRDTAIAQQMLARKDEDNRFLSRSLRGPAEATDPDLRARRSDAAKKAAATRRSRRTP